MLRNKVLQLMVAGTLLSAGVFASTAAHAACKTPTDGKRYLHCSGQPNWGFQGEFCRGAGNVWSYKGVTSSGAPAWTLLLSNVAAVCVEAAAVKNGKVMSGCHLTDTTADGSSVADGDGCDGATQVAYYALTRG